jgi:hypothetical protein
MILAIGPRYAKPLDNTVVLDVHHRTTGGGVSVLLDDLAVKKLADFMSQPLPHGHHSVNCTQTTAIFTWDYTLLKVAIFWRGSGRTARITLAADQVRALVTWFRDKALAYEWDGWLRPEDVPTSFHDHVRVGGQLVQPCRLCELKKGTPAL